MVAGFFPAPYPNECMYSILCRCYTRSGDEGYEAVSNKLFGNIQPLTTSIYLPMRIECVDNWVSPLSGITRSSIAVYHTLYPYWTITYTSDFRTKIEHVINGGKPSAEFYRLGAFKSSRSWSEFLKYCPLCAAEDIDTYGETYWRRQHQLPEILYCVKHEVRLVDSSVYVKRAKNEFYPASCEVSIVYDANTQDKLVQYKDKLLKIGQECEWLIKHGVEINWMVNGYEKYWRLLRDKGLASFQGNCDYPALDSALIDYWGQDFLDTLFAMTGTHFNGWKNKMTKNEIYKHKPLYHILMMCFLAGSTSEFIKSSPADTPYGNPPFICENPICLHYNIDGAEMVSLRYNDSVATATFECSYCGIRYKQSKGRDYKGLRVIIDYGHLWNAELIRCHKDPQMTDKQTTEILKCSMKVLRNQKKKLLNHPHDTHKTRVRELREKYYAQLLNRVREVADRLSTEGYPTRQVTFGYIARLTETTRDTLRCMRTRSEECTLPNELIETKADWLRRRTYEICKERIALSKPTTVKTIRWKLWLHSSTFAKYESLLQKVIDTTYKFDN